MSGRTRYAAEAEGEVYDVAVIGAGPAGAMAALRAAGDGRRVLLIEKANFPRDKVCGCCLSGAAVALLEAAGLRSVLREATAVERFEVTANGRTAALGLHGGVAISRARLDAALVERAREAGAEFVDGTTATVGAVVESGRVVRLSPTRPGGGERESEAKSVKAGVVIVADGLGGRSVRDDDFQPRIARRARVGLAGMIDDADLCERGAIRMAVGRSGYAGFVRLEDGRMNIAAAVDPAALKHGGGSAAAIERIVREAGWPIAERVLREAHWRGTPALTRRRENVVGQRMLIAGDAAGYVEPFTGEGIAWALATGAAAGELAGRMLDAGDGIEREWQRQWRALVAGPQRRCRLIAAMLRRPTAVAVGIGVLRQAPWVGGLVTRRLAAPLKGAIA